MIVCGGVIRFDRGGQETEHLPWERTGGDRGDSAGLSTRMAEDEVRLCSEWDSAIAPPVWDSSFVKQVSIVAYESNHKITCESCRTFEDWLREHEVEPLSELWIIYWENADTSGFRSKKVAQPTLDEQLEIAKENDPESEPDHRLDRISRLRLWAWDDIHAAIRKHGKP